jgi:hypothetical protein
MEKHQYESLSNAEEGLMTHEITPKDRLQNQIRLAADIFLVLEGDGRKKDESERDFHNRIMNFWVEEGYSKLYRDIEEDIHFKVHPRLQGDIFKIVPADILYYKENGELSEE